MKVISNLHTKLCRVECSCCGEGHDVDFCMPTKKYLMDEFFVYMTFRQDSFDLKDRIRLAKNFGKNFNNLKNLTQIWDGIIVEYDQLADLYSTLKLEYEQNDLLHDDDFKHLTDVDFKITTDSTNSFKQYLIFTSKEGLAIEVEADRFNDKNIIDPSGKLIIQGINIGYCVPENLSKLDIFKRQLQFIFSRRKNRIFNYYELSLSKNEFIRFMNILDWILANLNEKMPGVGDYEVEDESSIKWD